MPLPCDLLRSEQFSPEVCFPPLRSRWSGCNALAIAFWVTTMMPFSARRWISASTSAGCPCSLASVIRASRCIVRKDSPCPFRRLCGSIRSTNRLASRHGRRSRVFNLHPMPVLNLHPMPVTVTVSAGCGRQRSLLCQHLSKIAVIQHSRHR